MTGDDPVVLLPGLACDSRIFAMLLPQLTRERAVTVAALTHDDTIAAMAWRVLAHAPSRFALVGYSLGGYVALEIVRVAPERVARLAIASAHGAADDDAGRARRAALIAEVSAGRFEPAMARVLSALLGPSARDHAALRDATLRMMIDVGPEVFVRQSRAMASRADAWPYLGDIRCPTLVVAGENDPVSAPGHQARMASAIPGARLATIADTGHVVPLEAPRAFGAYLRGWLA